MTDASTRVDEERVLLVGTARTATRVFESIVRQLPLLDLSSDMTPGYAPTRQRHGGPPAKRPRKPRPYKGSKAAKRASRRKRP